MARPRKTSTKDKTSVKSKKPSDQEKIQRVIVVQGKGQNFVESGWIAIFAILLIFIINLIIQYIIIRINHKPMFDWWNMYGGKAYDDKFSMFSLVTSSSNTILFYLNKLFTSPMSHLNIAEVRFIYEYLLPYQRYTDSKTGQHGILTPKSLCETVMLSPDDGDVPFTEWFNTAKKDGQVPDYSKKLSYHQTSTKDPKTNIVYYSYVYTTPGVQGVYPAPTDRPSWAGLIMDWLNGSDEGKNGTGYWRWQLDGDNVYIPTVMNTKVDPSELMKNWFDPARGDNFLSRMNITPDAPLITYYLTDQWSTSSIKVDANSFTNMLASGSKSASGGWLGFLQNLEGSSTSAENYYNLISTHTYAKPVPPPPACKKASVGAGFLAGLGSLLSAGMMLAMMIPTGGIGLPFALAGVAAAGGAGISGYQAGKGTCP
jgi:hypothetical protein